MPDVEEVIIYIHGISPARSPTPHTTDYDAFESLFQAELAARRKRYPAHRIDVEWGFEAPGVETRDRMLAAVEAALAERVGRESDRERDLTVNPLRPLHTFMRDTFLLGLADMFYYVSEDGKAEVRHNVLNALLERLPALAAEDTLSLTIIAHSAGTVIMHDLLFIMFGGSSKSFLTGESTRRLAALQARAAAGRVFVKCFVTLGSPITPLIVRSHKLLDRIYADGRLTGQLDLAGIGIGRGPLGESRWLNFWDKDDPVSFPVAFLYDNPDRLLEDCYVDVGDVFPLVHLNYWKSRAIARIVAERY